MKTSSFMIRGLTPLIMHNGRLADPLDPAAQLLAKLSKKKSKTEADHIALGEAEWHGSLYLDDTGKPCIPGEVIEATLTEGAKKYKLGKKAKGALIVEGSSPLVYKGPKDAKALYADGGFIKRAGVKIKQNRVIRTRPIFPEWELSFEVHWDETQIQDEAQLEDIVEAAGQTGIGDWRPKFGRFEIV